jgi:hypothetical protein
MAHLLSYFRSLLRDAERSYILYYVSHQLENLSEEELEISHHWSTAQQLIGFQNGPEML